MTELYCNNCYGHKMGCYCENTAGRFYNIFLTVHPRIILVGDQLEEQYLLQCVYLNPLHVSSHHVLILKRIIVLNQPLV
jgi:hypothetical protein